MKKYVVTLTEKQRETLTRIVKKQEGGHRRIRRAQILLKSDVSGPAWKEEKIALAFDCAVQTVALIRKHFVERGLEQTMAGLPRKSRGKVFNEDQEAKIIALRHSDAPEGSCGWTLRLLTEKAIELEIVESVSYQTVRRILKKQEQQRPAS